jgi:nitrite reductase/ring-hydroxylating ferredoxin subunit
VAGRVERADEAEESTQAVTPPRTELQPNEVYAADLPPGAAKKIEVEGQKIAVYNVAGTFYATQENCTHVGGPLSEGELSGQVVTCPWHFSCFDVTDGAVKCGPAQVALRTFPVSVRGEVVCVETGPQER